MYTYTYMYMYVYIHIYMYIYIYYIILYYIISYYIISYCHNIHPKKVKRYTVGFRMVGVSVVSRSTTGRAPKIGKFVKNLANKAL